MLLVALFVANFQAVPLDPPTDSRGAYCVDQKATSWETCSTACIQYYGRWLHCGAPFFFHKDQ